MKRADIRHVVARMPSTHRGAVILALAVLCALVLLSMVNSLTERRINEAKQQLRLDSLAAVLPPGPFDSNPVDSLRQHTVPVLGGAEPMDVYTAYKNEKPAAAVLELLAPDGYSGNIRLLVGLQPDGTTVAARVVEHRETPGLGDAIDIQRSDWINQFTGHSLLAAEPMQWQLGPAADQFDAMTGATITSRAVLQAIHRALQWFEMNQDEVFKQ